MILPLTILNPWPDMHYKIFWKNKTLYIVCLFFVCLMLSAQEICNYDESKVPAYVLPDICSFINGKTVTNASEWELRRAEIIELFEKNVYGKIPSLPFTQKYIVTKVNNHALGGKAIRKEILIRISTNDSLESMLLVYLPTGVLHPVPVFLGMNFYGNQSIHPDTGISLCVSWVQWNNAFGTIQ